MHDYLLSSEWVRFAFVFGVAVSMLLYERRHLTTGSIVVPGYIAVFMIHPLVIVATFVNALITYWLVNVILRRFFLLYGRTKFTILAAISTVIQTVMLRTTPRGEWLWESDIPLLIGVGYVVPALIAHDMARQGVWKTSKSVLLAGSIVASPIAIALVFDLPGVNDLAPLDGFGSTAIDGRWLPLAVLLSVLASWAVAKNYGLRSGGFVGAAFIGMFMADPWQVAAAAASATLTYLIVTRVLMNSMILFGRRKFSAMLLVSSLLSWTTLWFGARFLDAEWQSHLSLGSLALTPLLLPGLLANDAQRTAPRKVIAGVALAGSFVLTTTWWVQSVATGAVLHPGWKVIAVATAAAAFWPQLTTVVGRVRSLVTGRTGQTAGAPQPARVPVPAEASVVPADGGLVSVSWSSWAAQHRTEADRALAWLDAQLGVPVPAAATAPVSMIDDITVGVLETALAGDRGIAPVPRRRRRSPLATQPAVRPHWAEISETSGGAREAPSAPSDVSVDRPVREDLSTGI
ncbi:MAG: poly-gamma-glutamate biosynthesis protein PgsC/CapC [Ilumatobacteraceae bacterium]